MKKEDPFPSSDGLDIKKLAGAAFNTDSCSAAQKARGILRDNVGGCIWEQDCHHHLRNVWFKTMEISLTTRLNQMMKDDLEHISPELHIKTSFARLFDRGFSRNANYVVWRELCTLGQEG